MHLRVLHFLDSVIIIHVLTSLKCCETGNSACTACPSGSTTEGGVGSTSQNNCIDGTPPEPVMGRCDGGGSHWDFPHYANLQTAWSTCNNGVLHYQHSGTEWRYVCCADSWTFVENTNGQTYLYPPSGWCGPGTYYSGTACVNCPSDSSSPQESTDISACTCNAGFTGPDGGTCSACSEDTYKDVTGNSACTPCPSGQTTSGNTGSTAASECAAASNFPPGVSCIVTGYYTNQDWYGGTWTGSDTNYAALCLNACGSTRSSPCAGYVNVADMIYNCVDTGYTGWNSNTYYTTYLYSAHDAKCN